MASIPVILILGFNVLVNMGTGFNGEIITYSKYYRFNLIAIGVLILWDLGEEFERGINGGCFQQEYSQLTVLFATSDLGIPVFCPKNFVDVYFEK